MLRSDLEHGIILTLMEKLRPMKKGRTAERMLVSGFTLRFIRLIGGGVLLVIMLAIVLASMKKK